MKIPLDSIVPAYKLINPWRPDDTITATPLPIYCADAGHQWVITHVRFEPYIECPAVAVWLMTYTPEGFVVEVLLEEVNIDGQA